MRPVYAADHRRTDLAAAGAAGVDADANSHCRCCVLIGRPISVPEIQSFPSCPGSGYASGDFNYDGIISGDDYSIIVLNIAARGPALAGGNGVGRENSGQS